MNTLTAISISLSTISLIIAIISLSISSNAKIIAEYYNIQVITITKTCVAVTYGAMLLSFFGFILAIINIL